jgi:hypothetical protein
VQCGVPQDEDVVGFGVARQQRLTIVSPIEVADVGATLVRDAELDLVLGVRGGTPARRIRGVVDVNTEPFRQWWGELEGEHLDIVRIGARDHVTKGVLESAVQFGSGKARHATSD